MIQASFEQGVNTRGGALDQQGPAIEDGLTVIFAWRRMSFQPFPTGWFPIAMLRQPSFIFR